MTNSIQTIRHINLSILNLGVIRLESLISLISGVPVGSAFNQRRSNFKNMTLESAGAKVKTQMKETFKCSELLITLTGPFLKLILMGIRSQKMSLTLGDQGK